MTLTEPQAFESTPAGEVRTPAHLVSTQGVVAFDARFADLFAVAYRVVRKWSSDDARAADLAQEAMVRTYLRWNSVSAMPHAESWVARVAANIAVDDWRRRERHRRVAHLLDRTNSTSAEDHGIAVDLSRALAQLPRRQREVIVLRYLADQSEHDVAAALGCTVGTVCKAASRGLAALRESLGEYALEEPTAPATARAGSAVDACAAAQRRRARRRVAGGAAGLALVIAVGAFCFNATQTGRRAPVANSSTSTSAVVTTTAAANRTTPTGGEQTSNGAIEPTGALGNPVSRANSAGGGGTSSSSAGASSAGPSGDGAPGPAGSQRSGSRSMAPSPGSPSTAAPTTVSQAGPTTVAPVPAATELGFFGEYTPTRVDPETRATEVGMRFKSDVPGTITGMRFYKFATNTGTHVGTLWDVNGNVLARVTFTNETSAGWQRANFATPVGITPGAEYVVSYLAPNGQYASEQYYFSDFQLDVGVLHAPRSNGLYVYDGGLPVNEFASENYYVDPVFVRS